MTPKRFARLQRFERVLEAMGTGRNRRLERIAVESGYADQPHLNRDFRAFVGITPTDYLRRTTVAAGRRD